MKRRRLPLWLLRDAPALAGVMATLLLFVATLVRYAFGRNRGRTPAREQRLFHLLACTETFFNFAILREAYRRLGFNHRLLQPELYAPPTSLEECDRRFHAWLHAALNLDHMAAIATERLRRHYAINRAEAAARSARTVRGSAVAARPVSAHPAVGAAHSPNTPKQRALTVSSAQRARPSNHAGALRSQLNARGPPQRAKISLIPTPEYLAA